MVGPGHVGLVKCTPNTLVDVVMDLTDGAVYWMLEGSVVTRRALSVVFCFWCGPVDPDLYVRRTLSSLKGVVLSFGSCHPVMVLSLSTRYWGPGVILI